MVPYSIAGVEEHGSPTNHYHQTLLSLINPKTRLDQHKERSMELDAIQIYSISTGSENVVYQSVIKTMYGAAIAEDIAKCLQDDL